ncbi:MAG: shikimate kinase [Rothia sp. (in: high G+C Gram-positive bacteria)]|nr:shikimate kinase [Rothia sp. (in: high G+C Gram-positive bacteria)]
MSDRSHRGTIDMTGAISPHQVREVQETYIGRSRPVVIIGPMAAGKSYIGTHLARFYGYEFLDSDHLIVEKYGEIPQIFSDYGEAEFRRIEAEVIKDVLSSPARRNTIFSLGGGAPMTASTAELLANETVIYIKVDAETVAPRIANPRTRPLLQPNPVEKWQEIFEKRREQFEQLASYTLDTRGGRGISDMAAEIQNFILRSRKGIA